MWYYPYTVVLGNFHHPSRVSTCRETSSAAPPRGVHTWTLWWQRRGNRGYTVRIHQGTHPERSVDGHDRRDRHLPGVSRRAAGCGISQGTHRVIQEGDRDGPSLRIRGTRHGR